MHKIQYISWLIRPFPNISYHFNARIINFNFIDQIDWATLLRIDICFFYIISISMYAYLGVYLSLQPKIYNIN